MDGYVARSNGSRAASGSGARDGRRRATDSDRGRPAGYDRSGNGRSNGSGYRPGDDRLNGDDRGVHGSASGADYGPWPGNGSGHGYGAGPRGGSGRGPRNGYGGAVADGFDRADGDPRGGRRAARRGSRGRGGAASAPDGQASPGQASPGQTSAGQGYPAPRRGRVDPRAKGAGARDLRDRLAIKARLGAITGTAPAVGRDLSRPARSGVSGSRGPDGGVRQLREHRRLPRHRLPGQLPPGHLRPGQFRPGQHCRGPRAG